LSTHAESDGSQQAIPESALSKHLDLEQSYFEWSTTFFARWRRCNRIAANQEGRISIAGCCLWRRAVIEEQPWHLSKKYRRQTLLGDWGAAGEQSWTIQSNTILDVRMFRIAHAEPR
jgi:hypothetical protein